MPELWNSLQRGESFLEGLSGCCRARVSHEAESFLIRKWKFQFNPKKFQQSTEPKTSTGRFTQQNLNFISIRNVKNRTKQFCGVGKMFTFSQFSSKSRISTKIPSELPPARLFEFHFQRISASKTIKTSRLRRKCSWARQNTSISEICFDLKFQRDSHPLTLFPPSMTANWKLSPMRFAAATGDRNVFLFNLSEFIVRKKFSISIFQWKFHASKLNFELRSLSFHFIFFRILHCTQRYRKSLHNSSSFISASELSPLAVLRVRSFSLVNSAQHEGKGKQIESLD